MHFIYPAFYPCFKIFVEGEYCGEPHVSIVGLHQHLLEDHPQQVVHPLSLIKEFCPQRDVYIFHVAPPHHLWSFRGLCSPVKNTCFKVVALGEKWLLKLGGRRGARICVSKLIYTPTCWLTPPNLQCAQSCGMSFGFIFVTANNNSTGNTRKRVIQ